MKSYKQSIAESQSTEAADSKPLSDYLDAGITVKDPYNPDRTMSLQDAMDSCEPFKYALQTAEKTGQLDTLIALYAVEE